MGFLYKEDINITDSDSINQLRENLLKYSDSDPELFAKQTQEFMKACGVDLAQVGDANSTPVKSFINGVETYAVKETSPEEYREIRGKAENSFELLKKIPVKGRQAIFVEFEKLADKYKAAIDLAISLDTGKPVSTSEFGKAKEWSVWAASTDVYKYVMGMDVKKEGSNKSVSADQINNTGLEKVVFHKNKEITGLGVAGATCGFNYPLALIMQDVVSSIVTGNSLIAKPTEKSPAVLTILKGAVDEAIDNLASGKDGHKNQRWYKQAQENGADLQDPETVNILKDSIQIISGLNKEVIPQWIKDSSTFRFVGGKNIGENVYKPLREGKDPKRTILELAGNTPVVVMPSVTETAKGLKKSIDEIYTGSEGNAGQRCTGPHRLFVHNDVFDEAKDILLKNYEGDNTKIGNPLDPKTKVGAIDKGGFERAQAFIEKARELGAEVHGGERLLSDKFPNGYYMKPALVDWSGVDAEKQNIIHAEEIFAPLINLTKVSSLEEAIKETNKTNDNLSGAIYTNKPQELSKFVANTRLGSVLHNEAPKDLSPYNIHAGIDGGGAGITGGLTSLSQYFSASPSNYTMMIDRSAKLAAAKAIQ